MASILMEKHNGKLKEDTTDYIKAFAETDWERSAREYSCDVTHFKHGVAMALEHNPEFANSIKIRKAEHKKVTDIWATMTRRPHGS